MIKAIVFDFFGVLSTEGFKLFRDTYFPNDEDKRRQAIQLVTKHDAGILSKAQYVAGLASLAAISEGIVERHMSSNAPNTLLIDYIKTELKPKYKIGLLSNAGDDYISQILGPEDLSIFDDVVLSYQHSMVKPQKEIFDLAAKRLNILVSECLFVDDSPSHCEGARRAGMTQLLYKDFPSFQKQIEAALSSSSDN